VRICLHIGVAKTGTTSIQAYCAHHARALRAHGTLYPAGSSRRNHSDVAIAIASPADTSDLRAHAGVGETGVPAFGAHVFETLKAQIRRVRPEVVLLSSEHLSSRLDDAGLERLRARLGDLSDDIRVLVYLRRQDDALLSLYSTFVKAGGVGDLASLADRVRWLDYAWLLDRWGAAFGQDRLTVRLFPPEGGSLIDDFCAASALPRLPEPKHGRLNQALDRRSTELLLRLNTRLPALRDGKINPDRGEIVQFLERRPGGPQPVMPAAERRRLLSRFEPGNESVRARYFPDRATLFADVPVDHAAPPPELTVEDALDLAADIWVDRMRLATRLNAMPAQRIASLLTHAARATRRRFRRQ
jgi:hypothetical protein